MPFYLCSAPPGTLDPAQREEIAQAITRIHCELTGAPPTFAHVAFVASDSGYSVFGTIRAGRTDEVKADMVAQMAQAVAQTAGVSADAVPVTTSDVPASWVMEGGELLPEPGEEAAWLRRHPVASA